MKTENKSDKLKQKQVLDTVNYLCGDKVSPQAFDYISDYAVAKMMLIEENITKIESVMMRSLTIGDYQELGDKMRFLREEYPNGNNNLIIDYATGDFLRKHDPDRIMREEIEEERS